MTGSPRTRTLVVGAGGLLGSHVLAASRGHGIAAPVRWDDPATARADLTAALDLVDHAERLRVAWCAGTGVVGSDEQAMAYEAELLGGLLDDLAERRDRVEAFFLASSAGAVYAGASRNRLDESSPTATTSAYGSGKLAQERLVTTWGEATGVATVVGRISNLYGPGQDLSKPQGLLSKLVSASLLRRPLTIYVDLDTRRDYVYARDAGQVVTHALEVAAADPGSSGLRIIASGRSVTVGEIVSELGRIRKRRVPAVFARNAMTELQPRSLVFSSLVADPVRRTPLSDGLGAVVADQLRLLRAGELH